MASLAGETKKSTKTKTPTTQCGICWNDCNKSNRKPVECPYCDLKACRECVKYYITSKTDLAHCMGCNKPWDRKFLQNALTKSYFGGTWKNHRKSMLFETEKARMIAYIEKTFAEGTAGFEGKENMTFGKLSARQWNTMFSKHLDHHLQQFGV